jgi:2-methylcitrate dehydratase PrpD
VLETSFKFHASCRHNHPAADALLQAMQEHDLSPDRIRHLRARVHAAAIDVLGPVTDPRTIHQSKFSMGFVLALAALRGRAGIGEFTEEALHDPELGPSTTAWRWSSTPRSTPPTPSVGSASSR